jgi:hypothetical protein
VALDATNEHIFAMYDVEYPQYASTGDRYIQSQPIEKKGNWITI